MAALMALGGIASSAFAQVEYVRELIGTEGIAGGEPLAITQSPVYYSDTPSQTIIAQYYPNGGGGIFQVDSATGVVSNPGRTPNLYLTECSLHPTLKLASLVKVPLNRIITSWVP